MSIWQHLISDNPLMEGVRKGYSWKYHMRKHNVSQILGVIIFVAFYGIFLLTVFLTGEYMAPEMVLYSLLTIFVIAIPAVLHNSIAGEREKRTLDVLMSAPVTDSQIVFAKFARVALPVVTATVLFIVPMFVIALKRAGYADPLYPSEASASFGTIVLMFVHVLLAAAAIAGICLLISARTKTGTTAMVSTVAALFVWLIVYPTFISAMSTYSGEPSLLTIVHPFLALGLIQSGTEPGGLFYPYGYAMFAACAVAYIAIAIGCIVASGRALERIRVKRRSWRPKDA